MNARLFSVAAAFAVAGCGASALPSPAKGPEPQGSAYEEVPDAPPPPRPEIVRSTTIAGAVWVDGQWERVDARWRWGRGGWVVPPKGARFTGSRVRRGPDGVLRFAPAAWVDAAGRNVDVVKLVADAP